LHALPVKKDAQGYALRIFFSGILHSRLKVTDPVERGVG
jgi:hypothetical protein